jgi:DNA-binding NtrC family response regulator
MIDTERRKSVLLVEDEILLCWILEEALGEGCYDLVTVKNGNDGIAALESRHFDALVTNIRLRDGPDGWEVSKRAKQINPEMRVIYVSGDSAAKHELEGVENSLMLAKPFEPHELKDALDEQLKR